MGFKIVVDGEVVHEITDRRVNKVHVLTGAGEAATVGIDPNQTELVLEFDYANPNEINVVDLDKFKLGYGQNLTGDQVQERSDAIASIVGTTNDGVDQFTNEAIERQRQAEEDAAAAAAEEPVNPVDEDAEPGLEVPEAQVGAQPSEDPGGPTATPGDATFPGGFTLAPDSGVATDPAQTTQPDGTETTPEPASS